MRRFLLASALTLAAFPARADITIYLAGPLTGSYSVFGEQMKNGAEMAVADLNAQGGLMGEKLVLKVEDDACDGKQAVAVANKIGASGAKVVFGHFCSGSSIPANDVYAEYGVLQITPASTNPKFTEQGRWNAFRACGRDDQQGRVAGEYIAKHYAGKRVAIVHDKQTYSQGLAEETQKTLHARGVTEALFETVNPGEKDYSALVTKLKNAGVDVLYYGGYHTEAGLIVRQMREQGLKAVTLMGGDALVSDEYWKITGPAGEGTLMTFSPDPRKSPQNAAIVAKFAAAKINPEGYTLYTYGAIQAWAQAASRSGSTNPERVAEALRLGGYDTVLGNISFDPKGDVTAPGYIVYSWNGGKYDYAPGQTIAAPAPAMPIAPPVESTPTATPAEVTP